MLYIQNCEMLYFIVTHFEILSNFLCDLFFKSGVSNFSCLCLFQNLVLKALFLLINLSHLNGLRFVLWPIQIYITVNLPTFLEKNSFFRYEG